MQFELSSFSADARYHLLTQAVIPRPVAWILSQNDDLSHNLAPFSYFNLICSEPPLVVLSFSQKPDGQFKDSLHNLVSGRPFVIHVPAHDQADAVSVSARPLAYGDSELDQLPDLALVDFPGSDLPRIEQAPIALSAELYQVDYLGPLRQAVVYARLLSLYVRDDAVITNEKGQQRFQADIINPLARLGGGLYAGISDFIKQKS